MKQTLFINGTIHSMSPDTLPLSSMLVRDDVIAGTGVSPSEVSPDTEIVDLTGKTIIPGLHDSHLHLLDYSLSRYSGVDLSRAASIAELQTLIREHIETNQIPIGSWVSGFGWNQEKMAEKRMPCREELDAISTQHPIFLKRVCIHIAAVNTTMLNLCGIETEHTTAHPCLGQASDGRPNGLVYEDAIQSLILSQKPTLSQAEIETAILTATQEAASCGLTTIQTDDLNTFAGFPTKERIIRAYCRLRDQKQLPLRVLEQMQVASLEDLHKLLELLDHLAFVQDNQFSLRTVKVLLDGTLGGWTAAVRYPYRDNEKTLGVLNFSDEELLEIARLCYRRGFQIACHTIGGRALDQFIRVMETVHQETCQAFRALRPRTVHCQLTDEDHIEKLAKLGILADIQPAFVPSDFKLIAERIENRHQNNIYSWQTLLQAGVPLAGSSDCPVESFDPFYGMQCAVTRQTLDGQPDGGWKPEQKLTIAEALALYTTGPAFSIHREHALGQLKAGFLADFLVLEQDPFRYPENQLHQIKPVQTWRGGSVTWDAKHGGV